MEEKSKKKKKDVGRKDEPCSRKKVIVNWLGRWVGGKPSTIDKELLRV